jgi:hypothetical protein
MEVISVFFVSHSYPYELLANVQGWPEPFFGPTFLLVCGKKSVSLLRQLKCRYMHMCVLACVPVCVCAQVHIYIGGCMDCARVYVSTS